MKISVMLYECHQCGLIGCAVRLVNDLIVCGRCEHILTDDEKLGEYQPVETGERQGDFQ